MIVLRALWADVPVDDLLWIDDLACHGNFRQWAKITYLLQEAGGQNAGTSTPARLEPSGSDPTAAALPHLAYSRDLVRAVFSRLDPTQRYRDSPY